MAIIERLRKRLSRNTRKAGQFNRAWMELEPYAKESIQRLSSATVASWEVASTALFLEASKQLSSDEAGSLVRRFSDGIVPTMDGFSKVEHQLAASWGTASTTDNTMDERLLILKELFYPLGPTTEEGWTKTLTYIEPVFTALALKNEEKLTPIGRLLNEQLTAHIVALESQLRELESSPKLEQELIRAFLNFGDAAARTIEIELDIVQATIQGER